MAVTAGYVCEDPREEFFALMDAANVDLKAFTEAFYHKLTGAHLQPVLETLEYLVHRTNVWVEITTLLIPGENDTVEEVRELSEWVGAKLGPDVPLHFTAFHPDFRMMDKPPTPVATLLRARETARETGLNHVYVGNCHHAGAQSGYCSGCGAKVIGRDWYELSDWRLTATGACTACGTQFPGRIEGAPGRWGSRRQPVRIG